MNTEWYVSRRVYTIRRRPFHARFWRTYLGYRAIGRGRIWSARWALKMAMI